MPITIKVAKLGEGVKSFTFDKEVKVSEILSVAEYAAAGYEVRFEGSLAALATPVSSSGTLTVIPKLASGC